MVVLSGSNARLLATQLADSLGWEHHSLETRRFPDSEGYIRIPSEVIEAVRKEPVVLVSNTFPDSGIVETLLMLEAINDVRRGNLENLREIGPQKLEELIIQTMVTELIRINLEMCTLLAITPEELI